ncbi:MAG TPA: hypothetical protein VF656_02475 [Pyrinomonadaceae bacterium]|jgi:hypothetical protein
MNEPGDEAKISEAIVRSVGSYLSAEAEREIAGLYGARVAARVRAVYDDALSCPVDWRAASMDDGLSVMHQFLDEKYPWLSAEARTRLNYCFIMAWK